MPSRFQFGQSPLDALLHAHGASQTAALEHLLLARMRAHEHKPARLVDARANVQPARNDGITESLKDIFASGLSLKRSITTLV
jgi:hypothetical protein